MNRKQPRMPINREKVDDRIIELGKTRGQIAAKMFISESRFNAYLQKGCILKKHKIALEKALGKGDWYEAK